MPSPLDLLSRLIGRSPGPKVHARCAEEYRRCFDSESGRFVLGDLARFCHGYDSTHIPGDPVSSAVAEGRRQVLLRIHEYVNTSPAEILDLAHQTQRAEQEAFQGER